MKKLLVVSLMLIGLVCMGGSGWVGAVPDEWEGMECRASEEACLTLKSDQTMFVPCANYNGVEYEFVLHSFLNPFDPEELFWQMDPDSLKYSAGGPCLYVDPDLAMELPCVSFMDETYGFALSRYNNPSEPEALYWETDWDSLHVHPNKGYMLEDWGLDDPSARPLDVVVAPDGSAWSTVPEYGSPQGTFPGRLARTTPQGFTTYISLPDGDMGFANPMRMVLGPDKALWFTDFTNDRIGRCTLDGEVAFHPIPEPGGGPVFIANGPDGAIWFTTQVGHQVGKITMAGVMTLYDVGAMPAGIAAGPDGRMWFALFHEEAIGRISTDGNLASPIPLPADANPLQVIAVGKGALVTDSKNALVFPSRLYAIAEDLTVSTHMTDGKPLWIAPDPKRGIAWVSLDSAILGIQQYDLQGPRRKYEVVGGTFVNNGGMAVGPDGSLWLGETNLGRVGRMQFRPDPNISVFETGNSVSNGIAYNSGSLWIGLGEPLGGVPGAIGRMGMDGSMATFEVEAGTRPYHAVADPHGKVWFTDISGGEAHQRVLSVTTDGAVAYHNVGFDPFGIALGSDGGIWVTAGQLDVTENQIARIDPLNYSTTFYSLPHETKPWGATTGSDGAVWFLGRTSIHGNWVLGRITPVGEVDLFEIPDTPIHVEGGLVPSVVFGSSGRIWIGDLERRLNVFTLETGEFSGWIGDGNPPGAMVEAADGTIWYAGFGGGVSRIDPYGRRSGRGVTAGQQVGIAVAPDGSVWYTDMQTGFVTRCVPDGVGGPSVWDSGSWNNRIRDMVIRGTRLFPAGVGDAVALMVDILWPRTGTDIWAQIMADVQATIDREIVKNVIREREAELDALTRNIQSYTDAARLTEKGNYLTVCLADAIKIFYKITNDKQHDAQLGPLAVSLASIHLGLLRERYEHGDKLYPHLANKDPMWLKELLEFYDRYILYFYGYDRDKKKVGEGLLERWEKYRNSLLIENHWVKHGPISSSHATLTDRFYSDAPYIEFYANYCSVKYTWQTQVNLARAMILSSEKLRFADEGMTCVALLCRMLPKGSHPDAGEESFRVHPALRDITVGPINYNTIKGTTQRKAYVYADNPTWVVHNENVPGTLSRVHVRSWDAIDGLRLDYSDGFQGPFIGNPKGGAAQNIDTPQGDYICGFGFGFNASHNNNGSYMHGLKIYYSRSETPWLSKWGGGNAFVRAHNYEVVGAGFKYGTGQQGFGNINTMYVRFIFRNPPSETKTFTVKGVPFTMVRIPAGEFTMGSPENEPGRKQDERQFRVRISSDYWMGATEVTQGLWKAVMGNNPSHFNACGDDCPVEMVSWNDSLEFIRNLNGMVSGGRFRFPTEAEWEYAARAGTTTPFNTGSCLNTNQANYNGNHPLSGCPKGESRGRTVKVGSFAPNAWGLYDIHGNVVEWCQDWYGEYPSGWRRDPTGPRHGSDRVYRGGSWVNSARFCRSANRSHDAPGYRFSYLGLRLARTP